MRDLVRVLFHSSLAVLSIAGLSGCMIQANIYSSKADIPLVPPTPSLIITGPSVAYGTSATSFIYTVTYSDVTTVDLQNADITIGGTDHAGCSAVVTNGNTTTATVTVTGCTGDGTMNFTIAADTAEDALGNKAPASSVSNDAAIVHSFVVTVDTTKPGSANDTFVLPLNAWSGYNFTVYWGDGTDEPVNSALPGWDPDNAPISHSYPAPGVYDIKIKGAISQFRFRGGGDNKKLLNVKQWGTNAWMWSMEQMFDGCSNFQLTAPDVPNIASVTSMRAMFSNATIFNGDISRWDTTSVTDMRNMFQLATAFNQPIGDWNTANVTTMNAMFAGATSFNQDISQWNTANVTDMANMFLGAKKFNQPLVRSGNSWNTIKVTTMFGMFEDTDDFNQDLSSWQFGPTALLSMEQMFKSALAYNQDLSSWVLPNGMDDLYFAQGAAFEFMPAKLPTFPP